MKNNVLYTSWNQSFLKQTRDIIHEKLIIQSSEISLEIMDSWDKKILIFTPSKRTARKLQELLCELNINDKNIYRNYEIEPIYNFSSTCFRSKSKEISNTESIILWQQALDNFSDSIDHIKNMTLENTALFFFNLRKKISEASLTPLDLINHVKETHTDLDLEFWEIANEIWNNYEKSLEADNLIDTFSLRYNNLNKTLDSSIEQIIFSACFTKPKYINDSLLNLTLPIYQILPAPIETMEGFDNLGNCINSFWKTYYPSISKDQLFFPENESKQLDLIVNFIKEAKNSGFIETEVSITMLDQSCVGPLQARLKNEKINHVAPGVDNVINSELGSLCEKISAYLFLRGESPFELIRQPYFTKYLANKCNILSHTEILASLDQIQVNQLITSLSYSDKTPQSVKKIITEIRSFLKSLELSSSLKQEQPSTYLKIISDIIFDISSIIGEIASLNEYSLILEVFNELSVVNQKISPALFHTLLKESLYSKDLIKNEIEGVEIFGWDESSLHDAPITIVTNCSEQNLPKQAPFDPILPEKLKSSLGLETSEISEASQIIILNSLIRNKNKIIFSCPKTNFNGDKTVLSKLLILGNVEFSDILNTFYSQETAACFEKTDFHSAKNNLPKIDFQNFKFKNISASKVKDYLECPFHFYLYHVLKVNLIEYEAFELEYNQIGSLLHSIFHALYKKEKESSSEAQNQIDEIFSHQAKLFFGSNWSTPLKVQLDLLKIKAYAYSNWHLEHKKEWVDLNSEFYFENNKVFKNKELANLPFVGIIDRISYSPSLNQLKIIDFKTGDSVYNFSRAKKKDAWHDPQLPIYALLLKDSLKENPLVYKKTNISDNIEILMSYVHFNKSGDHSESSLLYSEEIGLEIKSVVDEVITKIHNKEFWPPQKTSALTKRFFGNMELDFPLSLNEEEDSDD